MNRGTLPILARLRSLQATSRIAPGGARVIAEANDPNPLAQLLRAANETMLGRSLQFDSSGGPSLTLDVSGRRVLRLTSAIGLPDADACLGVEVLEDEHKDSLIKLLQAIAAPRHELRVTVGPIGRGGEEVSVGLPVALLADLVLVDLNETDPDETTSIDVEPAPFEPSPREPIVRPATIDSMSGDGLVVFAETLGPELVAWLILEGAHSDKSNGPEEMVDHLRGFLADERQSLDQQLDMLALEPGGPVCIILGATLLDGHSLVAARTAATLLLGVIEGDGTPTVMSAWRAALHQNGPYGGTAE